MQLTAALIGLRHPHSAGHIRTLDCLPEVTRIVVWDEDPSALDELRGEVRDTPVEQAGSLAELLGRRDLDFVVAAERNDRNPDLFAAILEAGHHLMAEKPLGRTADDARRVVAATERADRQLSVFYTNRYNPLIAEARRLVRAGALGALFSLEIRMLTTQVRFRGPDHWLFDRARAGGGILSWLGCHSLDLMPFLTGDPIVSVAAEVATRGEDGFDVEDTATLSMRLRSGALASLHAAYVLAVAGGGFLQPRRLRPARRRQRPRGAAVVERPRAARAAPGERRAGVRGCAAAHLHLHAGRVARVRGQPRRAARARLHRRHARRGSGADPGQGGGAGGTDRRCGLRVGAHRPAGRGTGGVAEPDAT